MFLLLHADGREEHAFLVAEHHGGVLLVVRGLVHKEGVQLRALVADRLPGEGHEGRVSGLQQREVLVLWTGGEPESEPEPEPALLPSFVHTTRNALL